MNADDLTLENRSLRERLHRLGQASLHITGGLDFDTVLQEVLDSARSLTGADYGVLTLLDDAGLVPDFLASGMTADEAQEIWSVPDGLRFFEYLGGIAAPLRVEDLRGHLRSQGLPDLPLPVPAGPFLAAPIQHIGQRVGNVYLAKQERGGEFSAEDEETLVMFAAQAALAIANARQHREERRARAGLETLIDTSPVGVVVFDAREGRVASLNREASRIAGGLLSPEDSMEQALATLTFRRADGLEVSLAEFTLGQAFSAGETVRSEEIALELPGGGSISALVNATPIRSDGGDVESYVVTLQDLTELDELGRLRADFLALVSQELREPLSSVKGSVTALLDPSGAPDPAEAHQFHRIIDRQADRMRRLISDLLDVARIETGTLPVAPQPVSVALLVEEAEAAFQGGGLHIDLASDLPWVMADRQRMVQALGNLLSHSAGDPPGASIIRVSAVREGVYVAVSVAADGLELEDRAFGKGALITGTGPGSGGAGSGLGLAICRGIVEAHGGRLRADNGGAGSGAGFTFTIPATEEAPTQPSPHPAPPRRRSRAGERILAVDDDPQSLRHLGGALSRAGYVPLMARDPEEALRLAAEERPDLILLGLAPPGAEAMDLMRDILNASDAPVIFLSAYGQNELIDRALDLGAVDYLVKPFSPAELAARVRAALRRRAVPEPPARYVLGDLAVDYAEGTVTLAGRPVPLIPIEYRLLAELSANAGRVVTHEHLMQRVWRERNNGDVRPMRTVVSSLRRKLGDDADNPVYIFTEPRVGYRMPRGEGVEPGTEPRLAD